MKKRLISALLAPCLCLSLLGSAQAAEPASAFSDVPAGSWFEQGAATCAAKGVMVGTAEGVFSPNTELTAAQCLTLALRLYDLQRGGDGTLEKAPADWENPLQIGPDKWYQGAVYTAEKWELVETDGFLQLLNRISYNSMTATREDFARSLAVAAGDLEKRYDVERIPDMERTEYNENIYRLYEAGILNGMDSVGTFWGDNTLTRAEAAVMVARVLDEAQRLTASPAAPNAYEQAVAELRTGSTYQEGSETTYDTDAYTIFFYDRGGAMYAPRGNITIIYKPGSQPGAGFRIDNDSPYPILTRFGPDLLVLDKEKETLTYAYQLEEKAGDREAGIYTYTVDLPTGAVAPTYAPFSYEGMTELLSKGRGYTLEQRLMGPFGTAILRWSECVFPDREGNELRDYELWLVRKEGEPLSQRLVLPSTAATDTDYSPTHRAPDTLELSEDGRTLRYVYSFAEALGELHEAGTYTYTVDLPTGELTVTHTAQ